MKSRSFTKPLFVCAAACVLAACGGGDDNNNPEPQPTPSANKYVGHWQSDCDDFFGIPVRAEVVIAQHSNGKDLLVHEKIEFFADQNCTQPVVEDEPLEDDDVLTWLHEEFADMNGRQVLTDAFLEEGSLPKSPHDWSDLLYQEGDTLWWYSYDEEYPDDNEFMPLHRKK